MIRALILALLGASLSACAFNARISPSGEETERIGRSKVWVAAFYPFERFLAHEVLNRFLYRSHALQVYSFEGIWDPLPTLEAAALDGVQKRFAVPATLARSHLDPAVFAKAMEDTRVEALSTFRRGEQESWMAKRTDALAVEAAAKGGEYLLEIWVQLSLGRASHFTGVSFTFNSWSRLIRLDTQAVVWCKPGMAEAKGPEVEDIKEYAANDLALFKETFAKVAAKFCDDVDADLDVLYGAPLDRRN